MANQDMVCGTGLSNQPQPGDPSNYAILRAIPVFGGITVSWTFPTINPFAVAHTLLYRGTSADFINAVEISVVAGSSYFDQFPGGEPVLYYYWIKFVSVNGTYADVIGPTSCWANPIITTMMELLTDKIEQGVLAQSLKTEIDRITWLADGLTEESVYRAESDATIAEAYEGLQASFDETVSLVLTETELRSTADSSLASQITTVQSQLGDDLASVETTMQANIDTTNGVVQSIGALWTAKVSVNGLVGGFGVYNDGQEVQAGFDVDVFWVGRTNANKVKPFIIYDGVTYIDNAMIRQLTADKIDTRGLSIKDTNGNIILSAGSVLSSSYAAAGTVNSDLVPSISAAAATAIWSSVSGANRPQDNATYGSPWNLVSGEGKPENNATYGSPWSLVSGNGRPQDNATYGSPWSLVSGTGRPDDYATYGSPWSLVSGAGRPQDNATYGSPWSLVSGEGRPQDYATYGASFGVNIGGQITPSNISTYIAGAAIGTAYIANAAITNALIGTAAVGTLTIAGNAVTTMGTLGGTTNQTIYLNAPQGGQLAVTMWVGESPDENIGYNSKVRLFVDGTERLFLMGSQIYAGDGGGGDSGGSPSYYRSTESRIILVTLAAGTHSVSVTTPTSPAREYTAVCLLTQR